MVPRAIEAVASRATRVVLTGGGAGFAGAVQLGIGAASRDFVLLLNDDAALDPGSVEALVDAVAAGPARAGAAPKIRFEQWPEILNSVGTILRSDGWADSRGIGQPDVGQYDRPGRVFGLHFAAALIRRSLFGDHEVGPLDLSYRLYYEDIDWCLRANLCGYEFVSAPEATAEHGHSRTVGEQPLGFQFGLQQRNLIWTAAKCFEPLRALRVSTRRMAGLARLRLGGSSLAEDAARALRQAGAGIPRILRARRGVQASRILRDAEVFALSSGERSWFDQRTGPMLSLDCLVDALRRTGGADELAEELLRAAQSSDRRRISELLARAPEAAVVYGERLGLPR
jgi:GT2 family glycosyltransferase